MEIIRHTGSDTGFPYIAYVPARLGPNPGLIIQLHGAGERGDCPEALDKVLVHGFSKIVNDENFQNCILVMPQCPTGTFWVAKIESLKRFIDHMMDLYNPDPSRIYLCGLSMGGYGTWFTAMAYPELFAAIAPCCGGGMAWNAGVLNMPVWVFHGAKDTTVSPTQSDEMVERLRALGKDVTYNRIEGVGHNVWEYAYNRELLAWLLSKKRG